MLMVFDVRRTIDQGGRTTAERSVGGPSGWEGDAGVDLGLIS